MDWLARAGLGPETGRDPATVVLPANAAEKVAEVVTLLKQAGIEPSELTFSPLSLDDVYLAIAAHQREGIHERA